MLGCAAVCCSWQVQPDLAQGRKAHCLSCVLVTVFISVALCHRQEVLGYAPVYSNKVKPYSAQMTSKHSYEHNRRGPWYCKGNVQIFCM
jgi:hypothetical protein